MSQKAFGKWLASKKAKNSFEFPDDYQRQVMSQENQRIVDRLTTRGLVNMVGVLFVSFETILKDNLSQICQIFNFSEKEHCVKVCEEL